MGLVVDTYSVIQTSFGTDLSNMTDSVYVYPSTVDTLSTLSSQEVEGCVLLLVYITNLVQGKRVRRTV